PGRYVAIARDVHAYGRTASRLVGLGQHVDGVVVELHPAAQIRGRIAIGDRTCPDGELSLHDDDHMRILRATPHPDGTLHADGVRPGVYRPVPSCPGYARRGHYDPIGVTTVDITDRVWLVDPGATVRGRIVSKRGEPVVGADIDAISRAATPKDIAWAT